MEMMLYEMLQDCILEDYTSKYSEGESNLVKLHKGKTYWFAFGKFANGGWPKVCVKGKWYDICMYENGADSLGYKIAKKIEKN